jgi:radical SAM superfamily enzyme YgiQ (UPF0313 family)
VSSPLKVALVALNSPGYQSLALGYLRAFAQADRRLKGTIGFATLDLTVDLDPWRVANRVLGFEPDVLGVSVTCWNARAVFELCRVVRAARPEMLIVLGGPEVGPVAEDVLAAHPEIDAIVRGEGEATFAELLAAHLRGRALARVDGVTARGSNGAVISAPDRALISDLDTIPSPYLTGVMTPVDGGAYIESYRGCPHRCAYCFEGKGYGRIRSFSEARVNAEIDAIATAHGVRTFSFIDPVFNLTEDRLGWLADALEPHATRGVRLHTIEVDIERIDVAQVSALVRAGVASVETGPQSIGSTALAECHRGFDRERFVRGVRLLRGAGISVECDLIVGLPGDTVHDFFDGLSFAIELDPGTVQSSTLHVLPGTDLWTRAEDLGLRYDPEPPHEVIATSTIGYQDLRRAEVRALWIQAQYRARIDGV